MGSKTFDGVWFISYSNDHPPAHVHGIYAETVVLVEVLPDGSTQASLRSNSVQPANARRSDVRRILKVAEAYGTELRALWEKTHGIAD